MLKNTVHLDNLTNNGGRQDSTTRTARTMHKPRSEDRRVPMGRWQRGQMDQPYLYLLHESLI